MNTSEMSLWKKLEAFEIDDPTAALTFSRRLARENSWSPDFTDRVVSEYRRYLYLTQVAGHVVVPSEEVDQVWHLHLTYTHSYWEQLCGAVLGSPLHHNPTAGGAEEGDKFRRLYERTLASYRRHFGEAAPADIWPEAGIRFGESAQQRRVNVARNWVIPKPRLARGTLAAGLFGVGGLALGPGMMTAVFPFNMAGREFLFFAAVGGVVLLLVAAALRQFLKLPWSAPDQNKGVRDAYAAAYLSGREDRCIAAGLASLIHRRAVAVGTAQHEVVCNGPLAGDAHPFEQALYQVIQTQGRITISALKEHLRRPFAIIHEHLAKHGLIVTGATAARARWLPLAVGMVMPVVGVLRIIQGINNQKPVMYLMGITIVLTVLALVGLARKPVASIAGGSAMRDARVSQAKIKDVDYHDYDPANATTLPLAVALFGISPLMMHFGPDLLGDMERLKQSPLVSSTMNSGCGSGCGGDGGGSGCGSGCGGCGGD